MRICDYGCGRESKYQFKNGKWCCSEYYSQCPEIRRKNSKSNIGRKLEKFKKILVDPNVFCENGCGEIAMFISKYGKKYCNDDHRKCKINREINSVGLTGNIRLKGKDCKLYGRKNSEHSRFMKNNNPMFIDKNKKKMIKSVGSQGYKNKMSKIVKDRWKSEEYRFKYEKSLIEKGLKKTDEEIGKQNAYYRKVSKYTRSSLKEII